MPYEILEDEPQAQQEESTLGLLGRTAARTGVRLGESAYDLASSLANVASDFPTSSQPGKLKEAIKTDFGNKFEPKNQGEEIWDNIVSDILPMLVPGIGGASLGQAVTRSTAGNIAGALAKNSGYGPLGEGIAKITFMNGISGLGGRKALRSQMENSYKIAKDVSKNASTDARKLNSSLSKLQGEIARRDLPGKKFILDRIEAVENAVDRGHISIPNAIDLTQDMNAHYKDFTTPSAARSYITRINKIIQDDVLKPYGENVPEFGKNFFEANDIYAGLASGDIARKFLGSHAQLGQITSNPWLNKILFAGAGYAAKGLGLSKGPALVAGTLAGREAYKFGSLLKKSKVARESYGNLYKNALKGNLAATAKDLRKLNKEANEFDKDEGGYEILPD